MRTLMTIALLVALALPVVASAGQRRIDANPCVPPNPCVQPTQPVIPEPSSVILFAVGAAIVGGTIWRRSRQA